MKLKNTLGVVIGSLVAASSLSALAQGQGAVEVEAFGKHYFTDSSRAIERSDGELYGAGISYFLTDDVSLGLSHGQYRDLTSDTRIDGSYKNIGGSLTSLDATYHLGQPGVGLRPYVSAGLAHQTIGQGDRSGRDRSTIGNIGAGVKYYFTENLFARAGVDGMYNIDSDFGEWMAGVGVGLNFGGGTRPVAAVEPAPAPAPAPVAQPAPREVEQEPVPQAVRVELDVKFDFDKATVRPESFNEIRNLADFMQQYPQTTTVVEGHTDSVGTEQYNQRLSERRAEAVRRVLIEQGVEANRVQSVGYGESRPVADNATEAGRQINRRVEAEVEARVQ